MAIGIGLSGGGSRRKVSGRPGMSGGGMRSSRVSPSEYSHNVTKAHYCTSPGCERRGQTETVRVTEKKVMKPHARCSPGCSRAGQMERVVVRTEEPVGTLTKMVHEATRVVPEDVVEPDPFNFTIMDSVSRGNYTLLKVKYHGCTNYEGAKILLVRKSIGEIRALDGFDPHFFDDKRNGLIARFEPTKEGWDMGLKVLLQVL